MKSFSIPTHKQSSLLVRAKKKRPRSFFLLGALGRNRTYDHLLKRELLYRLSYEGIFSELSKNTILLEENQFIHRHPLSGPFYLVYTISKVMVSFSSHTPDREGIKIAK